MSADAARCPLSGTLLPAEIDCSTVRIKTSESGEEPLRVLLSPSLLITDEKMTFK
jgi:hypothetical protein